MSYTVEKLEKNMAKITIEVAAEEFEKAMVGSYNKQKNKISVPGFRKGKVPMAFLEKTYGSEMFYEDAANTCIQEAYPREMAESDLEVVSRPTIDVVQMEKGKPFIFTAEVALKPEVTLGAYKGIEVEKIEVTVTEEDMDAELKRIQQQNSRSITVEDRSTQMEDEVTIDFEGFVDGVAFEGGKGSDYPLKLGSHSFIDTFEEQLVGKNIGDEVEVNVTFPEDYQAPDLAGKPAMFQVTIKGIKATELPELNDEFASEASEFETMDEYKEDIRKTLTAKKEAEAKQEKESKIVEKIVEGAEMEVPDAMVDMMQEQMVDEFAQRLSYQGLQLEQYLQFTGMDINRFKDQCKPEALKRIQSRLVMEAVANAEAIEVTEDEINTELEKMASMYQMDLERLKEVVGENEADSIRKDIAIQKAVDLVVAEAKEI
ncbi:MAG: trigger factor [Bacteroides sp.]|nr:trigger factor [Bacteroides sp.]MCM1549208.1 trigger factor [Clostridium sp.]